ncbi:hypothetical protein KW786_02605 [Candidatus Parcubacteria bacterium]|nr:hypothetical protein [Candidatus Parcubacteria bacterium]
MKKYWWKDIIIYEVYVDKFAGTFSGMVEKIEYLKSLGVGCVHLLPHYPSPMIDDGYDISDYVGVREDLGTLEDFQGFIDKSHAAGMKVIIDFVLNPWFIEARSSAENSKRDFYLWSKTGEEYALAPNLFPDLKDKNWIYNEQTNDYYFSTFHPEQADVNWQNPEVFEKMCEVMDFWVDKGVDGFRLDAASHLVKKEGTISDGLPETHEIIKEIRGYLDQKYGNVILLAEVCDSLENTKVYFGNGDECHLVYNFPLHGQLLLALKDNLKELPKEFIEKMGGIPENCDWVNFLGHHDEKNLAIVSKQEQEELFAFFDPEKKYRFAQGLSLRLADMLRHDVQKTLESFALLFSAPGSSIIYYGDEIGMQNEVLPVEQKDSRKSLRGRFNWDASAWQKIDVASLLKNQTKT